MAPRIQSKLVTTFLSINALHHRMPRGRLRSRAARRFLLALCVTLAVVLAPLPRSYADKPTATPLVTDRMNLALSDQFGIPNQLSLTGSGDVFFTPSALALFHWDSASGSRTRLLQGGDPFPGFPGSVTDIVGGSLQVNAAGHAAMTNFFFQQNAVGPRGVFVYDGTGFQKVALRGEVAPGTGGQSFTNVSQQNRINDSDQVAFQGAFEVAGFDRPGIFLGSPTGPPAKIAVFGETAPGTGGGTYASFQLVGLNNSGQVAFFSNIDGGSTPRAIFIGSTAGVSKVAAQGEAAPGTTGFFNLLVQAPFGIGLNAAGDVAFFAQVTGAAPTNQGVWIGNGSGPPAKLMVNTDPTGTALGGAFGSNVVLHGFNNSGRALFRSNPVGASSNHALFLKALSNPADVVFARNQSVPGGTTETFFNGTQASLNNNGDVAFQAELQGGPSGFGWFLGSGSAPPLKIALEGEPTPAGGTFGIAGAMQPAQINSSGQVAFIGDLIGPNTIGAFLWTPGSGIASIVNTGDTLPAGANPAIRTFMPGASDDSLIFYAWKAGGRISAFTKPLNPGGGQITRIFGDGDTAPGIGGALWAILANFGMINDNEEVACGTNRVVGGSVYPAGIIFTHSPGFGLRKVAATGDIAPGVAGGTFTNFDLNFDRPPGKINNLGQVAFAANIDGSAGNSSRNGFFIGSAAGGVQAVARMGDPSPIGGTFANFNVGIIPSLNDAGQVAFRAISQVGPAQAPALFVGSGTAPPVKLVAPGDAGPGGSTVTIIPLRYQMNNAGEVAYTAGLVGGPSAEGIFLGTAGGAQSVVALAGDVAPGTGGSFGGFSESDLEVNSAGKVAFWAEVVGSSSRSGYFLGSATGPPAARLVEGQALPGGGTSGFVRPGTNNFIGELFSLSDSGSLSMSFINNNGMGQVIADPAGALREFITVGEKALSTGGIFAAALQSVVVNSSGQFFVGAILVDGPTKWGIFTDK